MILIEKWEFLYPGRGSTLEITEYSTGNPYRYGIDFFEIRHNDMPKWVEEGIAILDLAQGDDYDVELSSIGRKCGAERYELVYKGTRWERVKLGCLRFLRGWRGGALGVILTIVLSLVISFHILVMCAFFDSLYEHAYPMGFGLLWISLTAITTYFTGKFFICPPEEKE